MSTEQDLPDVYKPLRKALKILSRPPLDLHAAGPRAKILSGEEDLARSLCLFCAKRVSHLTPKRDAHLLQTLLAELESGEWPSFSVCDPYYYSSVKKKLVEEDAESAEVQAMRGALGCGWGSQKCLPFVTKVLLRTIREISESSGEEAAVNLVYELDELIMNREFMCAYLKKIKTEAPDIKHVLWRGADTKGLPAWWLVKLSNTEFGLLGKLGRRWQWHTGDWDTTLAVVPDDWFSIAVETAHARR